MGNSAILFAKDGSAKTINEVLSRLVINANSHIVPLIPLSSLSSIASAQTGVAVSDMEVLEALGQIQINDPEILKKSKTIIQGTRPQIAYLVDEGVLGVVLSGEISTTCRFSSGLLKDKTGKETHVGKVKNLVLTKSPDIIVFSDGEGIIVNNQTDITSFWNLNSHNWVWSVTFGEGNDSQGIY